jgi:hypothetical protein
MPKRILFLSWVDVVHPLKEYYVNSGNLVFYTAGASFFWNQNTTYITLDEIEKKLAEDKNWAKNNFDLVITMECDIFKELFIGWMEREAEIYKNIGLPVFVIGAGANCSVDYQISYSHKLSETIKKYIGSILDSGGNVTLRGNFTELFLEKIGFNNLFVSGCPSLFIRGKNACIAEKVSRENFSPAFNARAAQCISERLYEVFPNSKYIDQTEYFDILYHPEPLYEGRIKRLRDIVKKLYVEDRIYGDMNYVPLVEEIKKQNYNFSYGEKLHGNILFLQLNKPCFIKVIDSRVREICEFFKIPNSLDIQFDENNDDLYALYCSLDFSDFNVRYQNAYTAFKLFLENNEIPNNLEKTDDYFSYMKSFEYYDYRNDNTVIKNKIEAVKKIKSATY